MFHNSLYLSISHHLIYHICGVVGPVDSTFDLCSKNTVLNSAEASHYITTVGKLFTPTMPNGTQGRLNQLTPGIASMFIVTSGKSFTCVGSR